MKDPFEFLDDLTMNIGEADHRVYILEPDRTPLKRGERCNRPTEGRIKTAIFVETFMSFCKLQALDLRSHRPELYANINRDLPDNRDATAREADAMYFLGDNIGTYTLETCLTQGRKKAPKWFNQPAKNLRQYMRTTQLDFSRVAAEDFSDLDIAHAEKQKINVLIYALNRANEQNIWLKEIKKQNKSKKPKPVKILPTLEDTNSKFPFRDFNEAFQIAHHAAVDPTLLWPSIRRYKRFFDLIKLTSEKSRKQKILPKREKQIQDAIQPLLSGEVQPFNEIEESLCHWIGLNAPAYKKFEAKFGTTFAGPHGCKLAELK